MENAIAKIKSELKNLYPSTEISSFCRLIIGKVTGFSNTQIILNKNTHFSDVQHHEIENIIDKLKKNIPIQYILGETEFYGLTFNVNNSVLIPRPETEELVQWVCKEFDLKSTLKILDIGTGSGCIAISLRHEFSNSEVDAFDISDSALLTAQSNAYLNNLSVNFHLFDILNPTELDRKWDIIVSNPPYILENEKPNIEANVIDNEPHIALFVPDNEPLLFYKAIVQFAKKHLNMNAALFFEINRNYGDEVVNLLIDFGFVNIELRKDISGNNRMIRASLR